MSFTITWKIDRLIAGNRSTRGLVYILVTILRETTSQKDTPWPWMSPRDTIQGSRLNASMHQHQFSDVSFAWKYLGVFNLISIILLMTSFGWMTITVAKIMTLPSKVALSLRIQSRNNLVLKMCYSILSYVKRITISISAASSILQSSVNWVNF